MQKYDNKSTSEMKWFGLAGTTWLVLQHEPQNAHGSIDILSAAIIEQETLEAYFWEQRTVPSPWNLYWTEAAREGGSIDISNPVF